MKIVFNMETGADGSLATSGEFNSNAGRASFDFKFPDLSAAVEAAVEQLAPVIAEAAQKLKASA